MWCSHIVALETRYQRFKALSTGDKIVLVEKFSSRLRQGKYGLALKSVPVLATTLHLDRQDPRYTELRDAVFTILEGIDIEILFKIFDRLDFQGQTEIVHYVNEQVRRGKADYAVKAIPYVIQTAFKEKKSPYSVQIRKQSVRLLRILGIRYGKKAAARISLFNLLQSETDIEIRQIAQEAVKRLNVFSE